MLHCLLVSVYCSTMVLAGSSYIFSSRQPNVSWSWGRSSALSRVAGFLARIQRLRYTGAVQVLPDVQGFPFPAPQLPDLVHHELFFQVVMQVAHLFLGLFCSFNLTKKKKRDEVRIETTSQRGTSVLLVWGWKMYQLDPIM